MPDEEKQPDLKHHAAHHTFQDILGTLRLEGHGQDDRSGEIEVSLNAAELDKLEHSLDGHKFAELLDRNFSKLDPHNKGITREELAQAILSRDDNTSDEYVMLLLVGKYFDTIANMCEDQEGEQTIITVMDKDVLNQFLLNSNLSLDALHTWRQLEHQQDPAKE